MSPHIAILGAGAMGSAFATPTSAAGLEVNLWGTHLDTAILSALANGEPHPRTGQPLAAGVRLFGHEQLDEALRGADLVACAIASEGVLDVAGAAAAAMAAGRGAPRAVLVMSKGFAVGPGNRVELLTDLVARILTERGIRAPIIAIGGPCKANEVAGGQPTATVYAATDRTVAEQVAGMIATDDYAIEVGGDPVGVEVAAALKNVYAIALGICDGRSDHFGAPRHNLKSAAFNQAVAEMSMIIELAGGVATTAYGLPGVGDLEVTGLSGRNRAYGELLGKGIAPVEAFDRMVSSGLTVEGHAAAPFAGRLVDERGGPPAWSELPLLRLLVTSLGAGSFGEDVERALADAVLGRIRRR
jgi:glycerol-3-phosphate dehydrogenase (NAD(P)+)